ncbi:hypothetical protein AW27_031240 [Streptomyces sp. PCS3-D2]|uniref:hypothetical protein n=1 Tax=Streptomyces sp. PCS3-D2 TaxID=1460244 RepID=UPI00044CCC7D|nr:hypothetical protein [Streptomyces sp. PCS3-D2]WKV75609.1 hypothetical protein AW27_031240 [Streptomyces sp. PCS3-D2]
MRAKAARPPGRPAGSACDDPEHDRLALLTAAFPVLAAHPPADTVAAGLVEVLPDGATDGGAWLRMLVACGATDAMEAGRGIPEGGLHQWVGRFVRMYRYGAQSGGGVARQPLPGAGGTPRHARWWRRGGRGPAGRCSCPGRGPG